MAAAAAACLRLFMKFAELAAALRALSIVFDLVVGVVEAELCASSASSVFTVIEALTGELGVEEAFDADTGSDVALGFAELDLSV